jgi:hypothetical protein
MSSATVVATKAAAVATVGRISRVARARATRARDCSTRPSSSAPAEACVVGSACFSTVAADTTGHIGRASAFLEREADALSPGRGRRASPGS